MSGAGVEADGCVLRSSAGADGLSEAPRAGAGRATGTAFLAGEGEGVGEADGDGEGEEDGEGSGRAAGPEYCAASAITWFTYHHAWLYVKIACASPAEPGVPAPAAHSIRAAV